jgi:hypothetical protein
MYLTGYNIGIDAVRELAESSYGASAHAVAEMTCENSVAIIYGCPERGGEDAIFNSAQLLDAEGTRSPTTVRPIFSVTSTTRWWAVSAETTAVTCRPPSSRYRPMALLLGSHWW